MEDIHVTGVVIKSNKYGINLILDRDLPFEELLDAIIAKFLESEKFSGTRRLPFLLKEGS